MTIPSGPLHFQKLSQSAGAGSDSSARSRARASASARMRRVCSAPPACAHGGRIAPSSVLPAMYGYWSAVRRSPSFAARVQRRHHVARAGPVVAAGDLEVRDVHRAPRLARDADHLVQRLQDAIAFAAHVHDQGPAGLREHAAERDQLVGVGVAAGRIDEAGGQTARPFVEALAQQRLHRRDLVAGRLAIVGPDDPLAQRAVRDEVGDVRGRLRLAHAAEVFGGRGPVPLHAEVPEQAGELLPPRAARLRSHGRHRDAVLAEHLEGDALADLHRAARGRRGPSRRSGCGCR